jgi:hypothetical protein
MAWQVRMSPAKSRKAASKSRKAAGKAGKPKRPAKAAKAAKGAKSSKKASKSSRSRSSGSAKPTASATGHAHCAATDPFGGACQNLPRRPSKYCVIHSYLER